MKIANGVFLLVLVAYSMKLMPGFDTIDRVVLRMTSAFVAVSGFFAVMMVFDAIVPHDMIVRLSIEGLPKTWAATLFLGAAWYTSRFHPGSDRHDRSLAAMATSFRQDGVRAALSRSH